MTTYRVDVSALLDEIGVEKELTDQVRPDDLLLGGEVRELLTPVAFILTLTNTGAGIVARGRATVTVDAECSRCLESFELPLDVAVDGFYVTPEHVEGVPAEQDYGLVGEDRAVDVWPDIESALALEYPFVPLHSEDCRGICSGCGANLNTDGCTCVEGSSESPFASLKSLLEEGEDGEEQGD